MGEYLVGEEDVTGWAIVKGF